MGFGHEPGGFSSLAPCDLVSQQSTLILPAGAREFIGLAVIVLPVRWCFGRPRDRVAGVPPGLEGSRPPAAKRQFGPPRDTTRKPAQDNESPQPRMNPGP